MIPSHSFPLAKGVYRETKIQVNKCETVFCSRRGEATTRVQFPSLNGKNWVEFSGLEVLDLLALYLHFTCTLSQVFDYQWSG
jgi:hypothetical protein